MKHLLTFLRHSVSGTLALTVGSPSFDRRYSALKHLAFMLLFLLGSLNVWGETITLTESDVRTNTSYNTSEKTFTNGVQFGYINVMTNNSNGTPANWAKNQVMQSKNSSYLYNKEALSTIQHVKVYIVVNDNALSVGYGTTEKPTTNTIAKASATQGSQSITYTKYASKKTTPGQTTAATTYDFDLSSFNATYFTIIPGGSTYIWKVEVTYETSGGGSTNPTISVDPESATYGVNDDATPLSVTATASAGDLHYQWYSNTTESTEGASIVGTDAASYIPSTTSAGTTYYYCVVTDDKGSATSGFAAIEVKAKHNIIFDTDLKSIANVSVMEGEIYNITETIEAALIASCTYTKFEGWTTATSIADASVKPSLVSSVTMSTADVTLKPVFSKTEGGGGSSEKTAHLTESEMRTNLNSSATEYSTTTETSYDDTSDGVEWAGKFLANAEGYWVQLRQNATPAYLKISADGNISEVKVTVTSTSNKSGGQYNMTTGYNNFTSSVNLYLSTKNVAGSENANVVATAATGTGISYTELTLTPSSADNSELYLISSGSCRVWLVNVTYSTGGGGTTTYSLDPGCAAPGQCYAPTFSPAAGTFDVAQNVELASATDGATIRYTIDGSTPSKTVGTVYSSAIAVSANTTIKAIAYKDGMEESDISTGVFNIRYAQPTFSLEEGEYTTAQNVTISADGAEHIYYTLNGNDPVPGEEGTSEYTAAISINTTGSHTIKAIAVKAGYANSNVASATYVMDLPYGSIAEFVTAKPNTAKDLVFEEADNCVITGINGKSVYVQDASGKGLIIFNYSGYGALEFHVGDRIVGTVNGKYQAFNGQHEMSLAVFAEGVTFTSVSRPTPVPVTAIDETAFNANTQILVKIEDLYYKSSSDKTHKFATTEGGSTEYTIYDQFGIMSGKTMPETSVACNLTGILSVFNTTYQLLPVFATDIVADADAAAPTVNPAGGADAENAVTAAAVEITAATGTKVDGQASKTVDINFAIPTEVTVDVTRDFYRPVNYSCGWYKAAAAKYNINGQDETTEGTVVAKVAGVEAATAAEGDEVHVFITPNAHFHLASILVDDAAPAEVVEGAEYSFTMPGAAVTIAVTWTEDEKYALTFTAGEGSGDAPAISGNEYYAGEVIQLPANTFTYDAQHKFTKWLIGETEYAAGANYTMPAAPAEAVAQWKEIPNFANGDWILVKDAAELSEGSYVIIASANANVAMKSYASGNNCKGKGGAKKSGDLLTYDSDYGVFEIGDYEISEVTYKTFFDVETEQYLFLGADDNQLKAQNAKDANAAWTITSVSSEGVAVVTSKSYNTRKMRYNSNSTLFACYTSVQGDVAFYKYHVPSLKLSYDANAGGDAVTNLPGMQIADGENKVTVSSETPLRENYIFNGWKDGESNDHAAGDVITLSENMTLYAQWRTPATVTISYDANGGEGTMVAVENQTEGSTYTIKTNTFERNGYLFVGWKAYDANDVELTITNGKFTVPATDVTLKAQWHSATDSKWVLVEYLSQLADGDKVIIAAAGYDYALSTQNSNNRGAVEISKSGKLLIPNAAVQQLTLGKNGSNYTFHTDAGYLYAASSGSNYLRTQETNDDNGKWTITLAEGGVATITAQGSNTRNVMSYNTSHLFACYASDNTQKDIVIYKYLDIDPEDATSGYEREDLVLSGIGTICLPYDVKASDRFGGVFYMPSHKTSGFANFVEETGTLKAGKAYIFVAENEFIRLKYSGVAVSEPLSDPTVTRGLIGTFTGYGYGYTGNLEHKYVVANNKLMECGSGAWVNPYRAYLDLEVMPEEALVINDGPGAAPRRRLGIGGNAPTVPTGMENVQGDNVQATKVLIDGELFILRGEKMYDAKGQLVK